MLSRALYGMLGVVVIVLLVQLLVSPVVAANGGGNDRTIMEANVRAPEVRLSVPEQVSFGNVTQGYASERVKIEIENRGTVAIRVTPQLERDDPIFSNLYFARRTTEPFKRIGDFSIDLDKPSAPGKVDKDFFYAKLDLKESRPHLKRDLEGYRTVVRFWAVPQ